MSYDNTNSGTLWMATHPTDITKTLDDRMTGSFTGLDGEKLRLRAKKQGSNWAWELYKAPVKPKRKAHVLATGLFSPTNLKRKADAKFDPPSIVGTLTNVETGEATRFVGFTKDHEFKGQYIQVVKARNQAAPARITL